ncbi:hypothetical protein BSPWISOX_2745 [uncultured Gammaproteobacteria bacterium]|jgi:hypothetical protein|nr:hypothetical protein BSPWISOX_2745 [uncultured Gammaproteobacteria bacterium]
MIYVFDSNTLIKIFNHYYRAQFPSFWQKFDNYIANGKIISVRAVKTELKDGKDLLADFVMANNIFDMPTDDEAGFIKEIFEVEHFQGLINKKARLQGKEVADPYLIARAKVLDICVVTEEKFKPNAAKIPNVCQKFNVRCINLEQFMQDEGWSF